MKRPFLAVLCHVCILALGGCAHATLKAPCTAAEGALSYAPMSEGVAPSALPLSARDETLLSPPGAPFGQVALNAPKLTSERLKRLMGSQLSSCGPMRPVNGPFNQVHLATSRAVGR